MTKRRQLWRLCAATALAMLCAAPAAAASFSTHESASGVLEVTKPFGAFGNYQVPDCQYEADANLVLSRWPHARITTTQVVSAWRKNGTGALNEQYAGIAYLEATGFAGHRAAAVAPLSGEDRAALVKAVNAGGVLVGWYGASQGHMFALVHATATHVTQVDEGFVQTFTWAWFNYAYHYDGAQVAYYAVTW